MDSGGDIIKVIRWSGMLPLQNKSLCNGFSIELPVLTQRRCYTAQQYDDHQPYDTSEDSEEYNVRSRNSSTDLISFVTPLDSTGTMNGTRHLITLPSIHRVAVPLSPAKGGIWTLTTICT